MSRVAGGWRVGCGEDGVDAGLNNSCNFLKLGVGLKERSSMPLIVNQNFFCNRFRYTLSVILFMEDCAEIHIPAIGSQTHYFYAYCPLRI